MAIRENMHVKIVNGFYAGKVGKVVSTFATINTATVSLDDNGEIVKVSLSDLIEILPQETKIVSVDIEIPEGAKKISRADFEEALKEVTSPDHVLGGKSRDPMGALMKTIATMVVAKRVTNEIFGDQDFIVMTEDEFISAIWSACNPNSVAAAVEKKMSTRKCITVAMMAISSFEEIVAIIFGEDRN